MKNQIWLAVSLFAIVGLWLVPSLQADEAPACKTVKGKLLNYDNTANCTGNTAPDVGHKIQYNAGSGWVDGPTTTTGGVFYLTPPIQSQTPVSFRAKITCSDQDHPHKSCDESSFICNPENQCTTDLSADDKAIHTRGCAEAK